MSLRPIWISGWRKTGVSKLSETSFLTSSPEETFELGRKLGAQIPSNSILTLYGDLGVGKTTFIKGFVEGAVGLSPNEVCSPTFNYLNIYSGKQTLYHFDLYRLKNGEEFFLMGFDEYFSLQGICCIEWPEKIADRLETPISVRLEYAGQNERSISISGGVL